MNVQALRSACSRALPEVQKTGCALGNHFRDFSTSLSLAEANGAASPDSVQKPSARQRSRAATSEIISLVKKRENSAAAAAPPPPLGFQFQALSTSQPQVIDVKSLPRGLGTRGRGAFRGRGQGQIGAATQGQPPRAQSPNSGNRFSRFAPTNTGRGSGTTLRGGRRGGRGGRASTPKARRSAKVDVEEEPKNSGKRQDPFEVMDPYEEQFDKDMRFGTTTTYQPLLTLDSLSPFAPAMPTSEAGRRAIVLENLSVLGTADPVGVPQDLQAGSYVTDLEANGVRFFAAGKDKEAAAKKLRDREGCSGEEEEGLTVGSAEESVRQVIFEQAVRGEHEKMKFPSGPAGIARMWHLRAETWKMSDVEKFEKKLTSLVGAARGSGNGNQRGGVRAA